MSAQSSLQALVRKEIGTYVMTKHDLPDSIKAALETPLPEGEYRTAAGAILATKPCARHCTVCEGVDHHWLAECDDDGMPLMVCKHCEAWREITTDDLE
jgi:hypothetical protein